MEKSNAIAKRSVESAFKELTSSKESIKVYHNFIEIEGKNMTNIKEEG